MKDGNKIHSTAETINKEEAQNRPRAKSEGTEVENPNRMGYKQNKEEAQETSPQVKEKPTHQKGWEFTKKSLKSAKDALSYTKGAGKYIQGNARLDETKGGPKTRYAKQVCNSMLEKLNHHSKGKTGQIVKSFCRLTASIVAATGSLAVGAVSGVASGVAYIGNKTKINDQIEKGVKNIKAKLHKNKETARKDGKFKQSIKNFNAKLNQKIHAKVQKNINERPKKITKQVNKYQQQSLNQTQKQKKSLFAKIGDKFVPKWLNKHSRQNKQPQQQAQYYQQNQQPQYQHQHQQQGLNVSSFMQSTPTQQTAQSTHSPEGGRKNTQSKPRSMSI